MLKRSGRPVIRLRGVRHNNLKNFDLDLPLNQLIVITGLSGSGKSSLAFDTLYAEGQRRYIETFSPYARQFLDRMDKPQVDSIEGIPPAIAIEQRNSVRTTRSTVGTMTEICDYMKCVWERMAQLHCRKCGRPVHKETPRQIWSSLQEQPGPEHEALITFELPLTEKLTISESLALIAKQGYQRVVARGHVCRIEEAGPRLTDGPALAFLIVIQDRLALKDTNRARFVEACEQAYHFGKGRLTIYTIAAGTPVDSALALPRRFSNSLHCASCDIEYRPASQALFSFNHPAGACPECKGFGRVISIDYQLAIPDHSKTIVGGLVRPWQSGQSAECQTDLLRVCREMGIPTNVPFAQLPEKWQTLIVEGEPGYGKDEEHEWPRAWYGVKGYFKWLESKAYKMHVRVLLSRYRNYTKCHVCDGKRLQPDALLYKTQEGLSLSDFYQMSVRDASAYMRGVLANMSASRTDPIALACGEVCSRLEFLEAVGLGYLTLDRPTRSLSGGETERVNLTTCLGSKLVNTLFVLDEPSVGLHPQDTDRLVRILQKLRDAGNTVVVVEHEASIMRAADQIIDLGPGHGSTGGHVVFQGDYPTLLRNSGSLTGQYLSGGKEVDPPVSRAIVNPPIGQISISEAGRALVAREMAPAYKFSSPGLPWLRIEGASKHNLRNLTVQIPLQRLVCVTGVSGSGKSTLIREVLAPALTRKLKQTSELAKASDRLEDDSSNCDTDAALDDVASGQVLGCEQIGAMVLVDQCALSKTPRSNPVVYVGAFDDIRDVFAQSEIAKRRSLNSSAFSFNSAQGQCQRCRGAGFEKIEMQFLSDIFIRCPECQGRRYRAVILDVKVSPQISSNGQSAGISIADLLESTAEEAIAFLNGFPDSRPAKRAIARLQWLRDLGLGYLKLGQPLNTLSGGEAQRLKLAKHLAESETVSTATVQASNRSPLGKGDLFIFDEPTTGLHFEDVAILLRVFQRLVEQGHSVIIIEHNLDVVKTADWVIDLGPGAGIDGGQLVAEGTPESVAACDASATGRALRRVINVPSRRSRKTREEVYCG